jgi:hypothetical protein
MHEGTMRRLLLARACEEVDPAGSFVTHAARTRAARAAREAFGVGGEVEASREEAERYLALRADHLLREAESAHPALARAEWLAASMPPVWLVAGVGLALGFALDQLGTARHVNLLSFPLLGVIAWNVGVIGVQAAAAVLGRGTGVPRPAAALRGWQGLRLRFAGLLGGGDAGFATRAIGRFAALWAGTAGALEAARVRTRLHVGAACLALGIVAGMYVAGFAFAYRATWESTFLDAAQVQRFLGVALGPASSLLGLPLPDVAGMAALRAPGSGDAAAWIHRWALTALLFVGLPRLALASWEALRARRLRADLGVDLDAAPFARLLAAFRGEGADVRVLPYSVELKAAAATRLQELLHDLFGSRADFAFEGPLEYGDAPPAWGARAPRATVVVFHLAQSPEREVHGVFVEEVQAQVPDGVSSGLLCVLDETRYREVAPPERVDERRRAWGRVFADVGVRAVSLAADTDAPELLEAARLALDGEPEPLA